MPRSAVCCASGALLLAIGCGTGPPTPVASAPSCSTVPVGTAGDGHQTWVQAAPTHSPPKRSNAALAHDRVHHQLVLFGGLAETVALGDTWTWDGQGWAQQRLSRSPAARYGAALAGDGQGLVLFGGFGAGPLDLFSDTWRWDGRGWTELSPAHHPEPRAYARLTYFDPTNTDILVNGFDPIKHLGYQNSWAWDGSDWTLLPAGQAGPQTFGSAAQGYDAAGRLLLLFGGFEAQAIGETWTWSGSAWTQQNPAQEPPPRRDAGFAFGPDGGILFGGQPPGGGQLGDTWRWRAEAWAKLAPAQSPPPRTQAAEAYDPDTRQLVLFGGAALHPFCDTWTWAA